MAEPIQQVAVYRRLVAAQVRADAQYRTSFALYLLGQALVMGLDLAAILVLFTNVRSLAGWSVSEVVFLYAVAGVSFGLADTFVSQVENAALHIKAGTFDLFLVRPVGPLLQLCAREFALRRIGRVIQPLVILVIVLPRLAVDWTPLAVALVVTMVVAATVIFGALWIITASVAFWTVETREVANSFTYGGHFVAQYPTDLFAGWLRHLVTFAVPLAFVAYLPSAWLLGKPDPLGLPSWLGFASPLVAVLLALVARRVWMYAVRHYRSTGS